MDTNHCGVLNPIKATHSDGFKPIFANFQALNLSKKLFFIELNLNYFNKTLGNLLANIPIFKKSPFGPISIAWVKLESNGFVVWLHLNGFFKHRIQ